MQSERPLMTLCAVTLDCADPLALADFYVQATGLARHPASDEVFAGLTGPDGFFFGFQRVADYRAPVWPGQQQAQQSHMDFEVDDLDVAETALLRLGAGRPTEQPNSEKAACAHRPHGTPLLPDDVEERQEVDDSTARASCQFSARSRPSAARARPAA